tara:strand:- start:4443 stop:5306 length:864 start_codon:yes stop_codon:yes gene_type:complete
MKPADLLFEKLIVKSDVSGDELIGCSEKRRSLFNNLYFKNDFYQLGKTYYDAYVSMLPRLQTAILKHQPLFQWENTGSSSWLFEKLHLENLLMREAWNKALIETDLKQKRNLFRESVAYGLTALDTLGTYHWEDVSLTSTPFMQDRYYLYHVCKAASQCYKTMNEFSVENRSETNAKCISMAFEYMDIALNVWKSDHYDKEEWTNLKALHLLEMAKKLSDDQCGERCALLKDIVEEKSIPGNVLSEYKIWKQQNEQVYYQKEETNQTITYSPLIDLFQNLQSLVEGI